MALVDDLLAVHRRRLRAGREAGRVEAKAHRAALVLHVALVGHEVDHGVVGEHVELGRVRVAGADDLAREFDHRALEAQAQAEVRDAVFAGEMGGEDLALDAAMAEPAGHEDAGGAVEALVQVLVGQRLRVDPADPGVDLVRPCRVAKRLRDREVGVGELDVLADEGDLERPAWAP